MESKNIKYCTRCVMNDESDDTISFDINGVCNYCTKALTEKTRLYFPDENGQQKLADMIAMIKKDGEGKKYDCLMGISGGLDSSYLAYLGHKWGLRILAVHIDDGYDTEISKSNIQKLVKACHIEMRTITPDPKQFNALTLAYMKAGVPNLAVPQDNILLGFLYETLKKEKIKYFLSGGNFALECILQQSNTCDNLDVVNIKDIHRRFGTEPIDKLAFFSATKKMLYKFMDYIIELRPLNYIDYNRDRAFKELNEFCGFEYYGRKHLENILTAFVQLYWLPRKFGVDKRSSHLSSMIVSDQMTREDAMNELTEPLYDEQMMDDYIEYLSNMLGISKEEIDKMIKADNHQHSDYKTNKETLNYKMVIGTYRLWKRLFKRKVR